MAISLPVLLSEPLVYLSYYQSWDQPRMSLSHSNVQIWSLKA